MITTHNQILRLRAGKRPDLLGMPRTSGSKNRNTAKGLVLHEICTLASPVLAAARQESVIIIPLLEVSSLL